MTERLRRVHSLLQSGNVPCALSYRPGLGTVLLAGTPNKGPWEVLLHETGGGLWILHDGETLQLPPNASDTMIANAVKLRVVQEWANQGDPEARAVIKLLKDRSQQHSSYDPPTRSHAEQSSPAMTIQFANPMQLALDMLDIFDMVNRLSWGLMGSRPPVQTTYTVPSPWGTFQGIYFRR